MATRWEQITELYRQTAREVTATPTNWRAFLTFACRNYRLPFDEQLLIYAQRPDATAVLELERWNQRFGRWVNRGAKGIAVFDRERPNRIRYYFDVADTHETRMSRPVPLCQVRPEFEQDVTEALENSFGEMEHRENFGDALLSAARNAVEDNMGDYLGELEQLTQGSLLEELDGDNLTLQFRTVLGNSVAAMLLARCGVDPTGYLEDEDFQEIGNFNTPETRNALGVATGDIARMCLDEIARTVLSLERQGQKENRTLADSSTKLYAEAKEPEISQERSHDHGSDLYHAGGLSPAQPAAAPGGADFPGQIRPDAETLFAGEPENHLHQPVDQREIEHTSGGDPADRPAPDGGAGGADGPGPGRDGGAEIQRPDKVGGPDEQPAQRDRGDSAGGADLQLNTPQDNRDIQRPSQEIQQMSLFHFVEAAPAKAYDLGYGYLGNGVTVWNRLEEEHGDYKTVAHVAPDRRVTFYEEDMPQAVREEIQRIADTSQMTISTTQDAPVFAAPPKVQEPPQKEEVAEGSYQLLSRLKADCDYFLGAGGRAEKHLWAGNVDEQIAKMRELYAALPEKPEWLTMEDIDRYAQRMEPFYEVVVYHHFENGFDERMDYQTLAEAEQAAQKYVAGTMEGEDGFAYDGAGIFDLQENRWLQVYGNFPDERAIAETSRVLPDDRQEKTGPVQMSIEDLAPYEDLVGKELTIDGHRFVVERISDLTGDVNLRDVTFEENQGFPINRMEKIDRVRQLIVEQEESVKLYSTVIDLTAPVREEETPPQKGELPAPLPARRARVSLTVLHPEIPNSERRNFRITDDHLGEGGAKTKFHNNVAAIQTLQKIESEGRLASPEEQEILSRYVGWGGLPQVFDENNSQWAEEFAQLQALLSPEEYEAAKATTLNAHYTSPTVIKAIYQAVENMGFRTGNILEPSCGIGNFFGLVPESMSESKLYGVELDPLTGRIAQQLYQQSSIAVQGFEEAELPDSFFDLAIGNVPFGSYTLHDKRYDKYHFLIHDYFFAKTLDKVRPGGIVAFITSKGTLDKQNSSVRKYIAERAELIGAIRLPNNAFLANAGTQVTTDILFLQKREKLVDVSLPEPDTGLEWLHLGQTEDGVPVNQYFLDHPEMLLGRMAFDRSMYGNEKETTCKPLEGADLSDLLAKAVENLHAAYTPYEMGEREDEENRSIPADPTVRNFNYTLVDGAVYYRENSRMFPVKVSVTAENRIRGMISIRDCARSLIEVQMENGSEEAVQAGQQELNRLYDSFTAQYGLLNSRANTSVFSADSSFPLLCSLEVLDEQGSLKRKADMFTKRTIQPYRAVTHVDTASEALAVSLGEKARVDLGYMASLTGKTQEQLAEELRGVIFLVPGEVETNGKSHYVTADEYLSGNVREKLRQARAAVEADPTYATNVEALEKVQPKDLTAGEISVRLGVAWIPENVAEQFTHELLETPFYYKSRIRVRYSPVTGEWNVSEKSLDRNNIRVFNTYGTKRVNAYKLIEDTLNLRDVRVFDTVQDENGKEQRVLNKKETAIAQDKQDQIKEKFQEWVWADPARRERLCGLYNEKFNAIRPREYNGSHLVFAGMNPEITLRPHQRNAVARAIYGGNALFAHVVGAGKSATRS